MTEFTNLGLAESLLRAVAAEGYSVATPIQALAIPPVLAGRDVLGLAQTGTGKTAAFALPILQRLSAEKKRAEPSAPRCLVLTPTRELALQIGACFTAYGRHLPLRLSVIHGGVGQNPQVATLARGVDILVATPGRLLDLMQQRHVRLDQVGIFVLDEADRMLDMGFIRDVRKVVATLPRERQTLFFSATMPDAVAELASGILRDFERVEVAPPATTVERIAQRVLFVDRDDKRNLLIELMRDQDLRRTIVFTRTKHGANRVAEHLRKAGIDAEAIHGNKSQSARQRALDGFKAGQLRALVATDIAARGIDIDDVTHVLNFELPNEPESYVHRIGRTARAGRDGIALSFCDAEEVEHLRAIEKAIRRPVPVDDLHPFHSAAVARLHVPGGRGPAPHAAPGRASSGRGPAGRGGPNDGRKPAVTAAAPSAARRRRRRRPAGTAPA
jgi:ATP-dependent RNA helicase RhlE